MSPLLIHLSSSVSTGDGECERAPALVGTQSLTGAGNEVLIKSLERDKGDKNMFFWEGSWTNPAFIAGQSDF